MALVLGISAQLVACEDAPSARTVQSSEGAEAPLGDAAVYGPDFCRDQADGEMCGTDRHCIDGRCHFNTCGDSIEAGDEQCDDGNELIGDGCTPACRLELMRCDDGRWLTVEEDCDAGQGDESDAGPTPPPVPEDCPLAVQLTVERTVAVPLNIPNTQPLFVPLRVGEATTVRAVTTGGELLWISRPTHGDEIESSDLFTSPTSRTTQFTCPQQQRNYLVTYVVSKRYCPLSSRPAYEIICIPGDDDTNPADPAGAPLDSGASDAGLPDPGPGAPDSGSPDAGANPEAGGADAGPLDGGGQADAQLSDAGPATSFKSAACDTCVRTACVDYSDIDFVGPCFGDAMSPDFSQRCSDVFFCSHQSPDNCAYNTTRGPVGCFCGETVSVDACQQGTVQGNCVPEWYAAAQCPPGDHLCVLEKFIDLTLPSGYANFLIECQNMACAVECTP